MRPVLPSAPRLGGSSSCCCNKGRHAAKFPTTLCVPGRYGSSAARCPPLRREFMLQGIACRQVPHCSVHSRPLWVQCCPVSPVEAGVHVARDCLPPCSPLLGAFEAVMGPVLPDVPLRGGSSCCKGFPAAKFPTTRCVPGHYGSGAAFCPPSGWDIKPPWIKPGPCSPLS